MPRPLSRPWQVALAAASRVPRARSATTATRRLRVNRARRQTTAARTRLGRPPRRRTRATRWCRMDPWVSSLAPGVALERPAHFQRVDPNRQKYLPGYGTPVRAFRCIQRGAILTSTRSPAIRLQSPAADGRVPRPARREPEPRARRGAADVSPARRRGLAVPRRPTDADAERASARRTVAVRNLPGHTRVPPRGRIVTRVQWRARSARAAALPELGRKPVPPRVCRWLGCVPRAAAGWEHASAAAVRPARPSPRTLATAWQQCADPASRPSAHAASAGTDSRREPVRLPGRHAADAKLGRRRAAWREAEARVHKGRARAQEGAHLLHHVFLPPC